MKKDIFSSKAYKFFDVLYIFIILNALVIGFTTFGIVLFAFMPSFVALFLLVKSIIDKENFPILKSFWLIFKKEYIKSQIIFLIMFFIGILLFFNYMFFNEQYSELIIMKIGYYFTFSLIFLYIFMWIHIFMIYIYFPFLKPLKILKYSILLTIAFPFQTLIVFFVGIALFLIIMVIPYLIPIYLMLIFSVFAYLNILILKKKYEALVKDKLPLSVYNYE